MTLRIGILTISDRVSRGEYRDNGGPTIEAWLKRAISSDWTPLRRVVPDGIEAVSDAMIALCDTEGAGLVLSSGGTGPAPRDLTPEAMRAVITRELPGFGEQMRRVSL